MALDLNVLVVDDEKNIRTTLAACLEVLGCRVAQAATAEIALAAVAHQRFDMAFVDLRLETSSGLDLLPKMLAAVPALDVVMITAFATFETAVEAIKRGARDYLPKPFTPLQIRQIIERIAGRRALESQVRDLRAQLDDTAPEATFETRSPRMRALFDVLDKAAQHDVAVLLGGESGTGKSTLARRVHRNSRRGAKPFVVVNCPTLSEELLASELFGHARGAFTGAVKDQPGRVESAEGGTIFLDEIGELTPRLQAKLLRFLQDKQFERIGESVTRTADARVLAATNRDLSREVKEGRFREDLLYRLNTFELTVPTLRERREDIGPLAHEFVAFFSRTAHRPTVQLSPEAEMALVNYAWPGNLRELRNAIERAVILSPGTSLGADALPERVRGAETARPSLGGDFTLDEIEREHILRILGRYPTAEEAARVLGIDASTLWRKKKRFEP
jgi:NtrC-family two-component system response regulator AlgB